MEYYAKFIDYRAEIVTRREAIHGCVEFETEEMTVFVTGGRLVAQGYEELASAFGVLKSQKVEFASAAERTNWDEEGQVERRVGEARLIVSQPGEADQVIRRLLGRYRRVGSVIKEVERIGRAIVRQPYSEYLREVEATGLRRVTLYSLASFKNGSLEVLDPLKISGQFNLKRKVDVKLRSIIKLPPYGQSRQRPTKTDHSVQQPDNPPSVVIEYE